MVAPLHKIIFRDLAKRCNHKILIRAHIIITQPLRADSAAKACVAIARERPRAHGDQPGNLARGIAVYHGPVALVCSLDNLDLTVRPHNRIPVIAIMCVLSDRGCNKGDFVFDRGFHFWLLFCVSDLPPDDPVILARDVTKTVKLECPHDVLIA
jgi:hypothetical protein